MPTFVEPSLVSFDLVDGRAVLDLAVDAPAALDADGWSALVRETLVVAAGPDDAGYLVKRIGSDGADLAPAGWDAALEQHGALTVVFSAAGGARSRELPLAEA